MIYREYPLPEAARGAALCAWRFTLEPHDPPAFDHAIPPDGTSNLFLTLAPDGTAYSGWLGPRLAAYTVPVTQGWRYVGLRLRPEAAAAVVGTAPRVGVTELVGRDGPLAPAFADLATLAASDGDWSAHDGIAATLGGVRGDALIARTVDRLTETGGLAPIAAVAAEAGLGDRHFRRRFLATTGVSPKQFASVQRLRRALLLALEDANWADVASEAGFADQPHLARDIKERFGAAPRRVAGYLGGIRHELLAPVRFLQDGPAPAE
jgi:AraC-like DNA-binding protein